VRSLRDGGTTILLTTHYLDEAEHLADRVGVINAGRIMAVDTVKNLGAEQRRTATVSWRDEHGWHRESTTDPAPFVVSLSHRYGGSVPDLEVRRPSLEDVYLAMIEEQSA
jgi:ABC-2 type transport system ATP-binding protein